MVMFLSVRETEVWAYVLLFPLTYLAGCSFTSLAVPFNKAYLVDQENVMILKNTAYSLLKKIKPHTDTVEWVLGTRISPGVCTPQLLSVK